MSRIEDLEKLIKAASAAYYDGSEPIMSDTEFDNLVLELKEIDPNNPLINKVGFGSDEISHKNDTRIPIEIRVSLPKYKFNNLEESLPDWIKSMIGYRLSPKLDGMSVIITYENNTLKSMISRGNGEFGMDLTQRFLPLIKSGKFDIPYHSNKDGTVRGELFIKKSVFEEYLSEDYANPRNATSGIVNAESEDNKQFISFLQHPQFEDLGLPLAPTTGMTVKLFHLKDFISEIESYYKLQLQADYPIDGIVIDKFNQDKEVEDSIAVKFPTESVKTTVKYIEWNLSPKNRYIPVIVFEPVQLYGTEVERATGLHYDYIMKNKIGKGAVIEVTKANEIIPQVVKVVKPVENLDVIDLPDNFTVSGLHAIKELSTSKDWYNHFSRNFFNRALTTTGVKGRTIFKFLKELNIETIIDCCNYIWEVQNEKIAVEEIQRIAGNATGKLIYDKLKKLTIERHQLLQLLGVDGIGWVTTEALRNNINLYKYLIQAGDSTELPVNSTVKINLQKPAIHEALSLIALQLSSFKLLTEDTENEVAVNSNEKVCLSGKFPGFTKAQLIEKFADKWNLVDSLDKDCKYLVVPTLDRVSSKVTKAKKWNIDIIDFNTFLTL